MKNKIHQFSAVVAVLCVASFFCASIIVELFGSRESISLVKRLIVTPGLFILVPAIAITGASGFTLAKNWKNQFVDSKRRRMPFIAANGLLILLPCAIVLDHWAANGVFGQKFYLVQALELFAGAVNLTLMGLNIRDGLSVSRNRRRRKLGRQ